MAQIKANGIDIEVERHGDPTGAPLLMIRGLGSQIIHWPQDMIDGFIAAGFHVITYDNRDAGLSQMFNDAPPYTVADMAADGIGALDTLGIARAHVLGISMGGMILQSMLLDHRDRLLSATIIMSSSRAEGLPGRSPEMEALLFADPGDPAKDLDGVVDHILHCDHVWGSPGFPFDEAERRAFIIRAIERSYRPDGVMRQGMAVMAGDGMAGRLSEITTPTLVIHGDSDALLSVEHGRDIADRVPGAKYKEIAGMGHDLDGGVGPIVVGMVSGFVGGL